MHNLESELLEKEAFLLDMDGVIHIEGDPIDGSLEAFRMLKKNGKKVGFLTNNSTRTREDYVEKFSGFGLEIEKSEVMTSAYATALRLDELEGKKICYMIGEEGLEKELRNAGFDLVSRKNVDEASYVVVGTDRGLSYEKIWGALTAVLSGAKFIGTNPDSTYPTKEGLAPGAGASIGAVAGAVDKDPDEIIGKPSPYMLKSLIETFDVSSEKTVIVGDRIETDVMAGKDLEMTTVLLKSGVEDEDSIQKVEGTDKEPDFIFENLEELTRRVVK